ncbi:MAG TPA: GNAT family N-acetyltransferase [Aggregatilineales bacterium]|nr:GNAT family N-acetyltransferase [Aggregatilineales bacterium]
MTGFTVRLVEDGDAKALHRNCWPARSEQAVAMRISDMLLRQQRGSAWAVVAEVGGEAVAYGQVGRWLGGGEISDVIVAEPLRGRGIGRALVARLIEVAREAGLPEVEIGAALSNEIALELYKSLGFEERRRVKLDLGEGPEPVVYLWMSFDSNASPNGQGPST